ncbi:DUF2345 domain-containing protein, partial [Brenneria populi]|nr:DUF2345 domain-containing protein [Brenneria populi Li et al. 2015]
GAENVGQTALNAGLKALTQAGIVMHAPQGVGIASEKSVRVSSGGESVALTAGKNVDVSVMKRFTAAAGEAISLLARKMGVKIFAAQGKVEIQAQSDALSLTGQKEVTLSSATQSVRITAQDELLLNCGGGYIRLKGGNIELGCPGNI